ncbi:3'-5' exonuclease [Streptomyces sp. KM273126]|uniref:3'-5' exonuclease n=1 Tax=Streptomyces sp. KM273126 TaxID=2545247 RepID=UPI0037D9AE3B
MADERYGIHACEIGRDIPAGVDAVRFGTLHGFKGLEFQRVFLAEVSEGLIPHQWLETYRHEQVERYRQEEQRSRSLPFVAATRARDELVGRDAFATHCSTSRSSVGISPCPGPGTTNAQCRRARRSSLPFGRPGRSHSIATVTVVSASLTSSRVFAARPGQCARAYSAAKAYQLSCDGPRAP